MAILSNAGGAGVLAADACARSDLIVTQLTAVTRDALAGLLPPGAAVANPVDTTATVPAATFGRAVDVLLRDPDVDAVIVLTAATAAGDPLLGLAAAGNAEKPMVAVRLGQPVRLAGPTAAARTPEAVPVYDEPGDAVRALAAAADRADRLRSSSAPAPPPPGVHATRAETIVAEALATQVAGCWLAPAAAVELVRAAGVPVAATDVVDGVEEAVAGWRRIGGPVAVKADVQGVLHKSRAGGVHIGLDSADQVIRAVRDFRDRFGTDVRGVVVQAMIEPGPELLVGLVAYPRCGPLLTVGLGGTSTDLVDDRAHRLLSATTADLDRLLDRLRAAPRLFTGDGGAPIRAALRDVVGRMAWLGELLPELAEAEINPLVVAAAGPVAVDVRVRIAPEMPSDPWLRNLPL